MNLFVGNFGSNTSEQDLRLLFSAHGEIAFISLEYDRFTRRSRGFGLIGMKDRAGGEAAVDALNNSLFKGQSLVVREDQIRSNQQQHSNGYLR